MSSCCNGKCGCGSNCGCGSSCKGCGMYPDLNAETYSTETMIIGVGSTKAFFEESEMGAENGGCGNSSCSCGSSCNCGSSCKCGK